VAAAAVQVTLAKNGAIESARIALTNAGWSRSSGRRGEVSRRKRCPTTRPSPRRPDGRGEELALRRPARLGRVQEGNGAGSDDARTAQSGPARRGKLTMAMHKISVTINGAAREAEVESRLLLVPSSAKCPDDGHSRRLRHLALRRVHRDPRRQPGQIVHGARGAGRRREGHHGRRPGAGRQAPSGAGRLHREARPAMRFLHARHAHDHQRAPRAQQEPERAADREAIRGISAAAPATSIS